MRKTIYFLGALATIFITPSPLHAEEIEGFSPKIAVECNPIIRAQSEKLGLSIEMNVAESKAWAPRAYDMTRPEPPVLLLNSSDGVDFKGTAHHLNISGRNVFLVENETNNVLPLGTARLEGLKCNGHKQYVGLSLLPRVTVELDRPVSCSPRTSGAKVRITLPEAEEPILLPFRFSC